MDVKIADLVNPNKVIQLGYPPNRIDLLTSISGVEFDDCYPNRLTIEIEKTKVDFIDLKNLKKNKKATGRYKDLDDLENLEE